VAEFLAHPGETPAPDREAWLARWGIVDPEMAPGGLAGSGGEASEAERDISLFQRKASKLGRTLGKTTGWIQRLSLRRAGVRMRGGVTYDRVDAEGLHIKGPGGPELIPADTVVLCAGQEPVRGLADALTASGRRPHIIGGADMAVELDAKRAIDQGARLAAQL